VASISCLNLLRTLTISTLLVTPEHEFNSSSQSALKLDFCSPSNSTSTQPLIRFLHVNEKSKVQVGANRDKRNFSDALNNPDWRQRQFSSYQRWFLITPQLCLPFHLRGASESELAFHARDIKSASSDNTADKFFMTKLSGFSSSHQAGNCGARLAGFLFI
jgi:hypothetical protein